MVALTLILESFQLWNGEFGVTRALSHLSHVNAMQFDSANETLRIIPGRELKEKNYVDAYMYALVEVGP